MAFNLDAALRVVGKVSGLNEFKQLTDTLESVGAASKDSRTGLQQLSAESGRLTQESTKATGSVKAQASALQELQARTRAGATDMRRMGEETKGLGSAVQQLRGQSAGAMDGLTGSAAKAANSIRQLQGTLQPTDEALAKLRSEVLEFGAANKQTERSLEQQVQALKNLRSQAEINGQLYNDLTDDMQRLTAASKGMGEATLFGVESMKKAGAASQANAQAVEQQIKSLARLQSTLVKGSEGYRAIGKEIDALKQKQVGLDLNKGLSVAGGALGSAASGAAGGLASIVRLRQELAKTNTGRVALVGEGLATAGLAGAAGSGVAAGIGGVAAGVNAAASSMDAFAAKAQALPALLRPLSSLLGEPASAAAAKFAELGGNLAAAQAKLAALSAPFEAIGTAISTIGPEASAAAGAASLAIASVYGVLSRQADKAQAEAEAAFKGISDEAQATLERLSRIYDRLPGARREAQEQLIQRNLDRLLTSEPGSVEARRAANAVVVGEREVAKIQEEINALLDQARQKQNAGAEALKRQVEAGRQKVATAKEELSFAERVAQVQRQAAERRRQIADAERAEQVRLGAAAAAAAQPRVLALPAAGQTSAPGTGQAISGGARTSLAGIEIAGTRANVGAAMAGFSGEARAALNEQAAATEKARGALSKLFIEIDKVEAASNGSVQSLQRQRAAWEALRVAVNPAAPAYEKARAKVEQLDQQLQKLAVTQEKASRRGLGREALGGALGALATGGGPQAAIGSLAGSLAFAGGASAMAAGGLITATAGIATYSGKVGMEAEAAQVRLKALADQFGEYNAAQAAAANIAKTLRLSNVEAQASFANLYASLRPTGITIKELESAFIGFSAAARNSGATAQETSNALVQLKQGLASGALQGEELRSIREQAPLVAQAIAKQFGVMNKDVDVSIGNLKDFAAEGKITTDVVIQALNGLSKTELGKLSEQFNTGQQAVTDFQNTIKDLGTEISKLFGPTVIAGLRMLTGLLQKASQNLKDANLRDQAYNEAFLQAGKETQQKFGNKKSEGLIGGVVDFWNSRGFFQQRTNELFEQNLQRLRNPQADNPNADQLKNRQEAEKERLEAQQRKAKELAKERLEEEVKIRQDAEKRLADAAEQREEQLRDFRLETVKRAKELERQLGDQRLQIEREIEANRLAVARAAQDRTLNAELLQRRAGGQSTDKLEEQKALNELTRQFEDQVLQARQTAVDRQTTLQRQLEEFKVSIAEGIGKIQEAYARSVANILQDAGEKLAKAMEKGAENAAQKLSGALGPGNLTPGSVAGGSLSVGTLVGLAKGAGFQGPSAAIMAAIAMAESRGRSDAHNPNRATGDNSYGLWQINMIDRMGPERRRAFGIANNEALFDPATNAMAARQVYQSQGFGAWSVYRSGAYKSFLPAAQAAMGSAPVARVEAPASAPGASEARDDISEATNKLKQEGEKLKQTTEAAQQASRSAAFSNLLGGFDQRYSMATSELDSQARSAREKLEDERTYQLLLSQGVTPELAKQRVELERIATTERNKLQAQKEDIENKITSGRYSETEVEHLKAQKDLIDARLVSQGASIAFTEKQIEQADRLRKAREAAEGRDVGKGLKDGVNSYLKEIGTLAEGVSKVTASALKGVEEQLVQFVTTGKANFKELARSILADMARIAIQQMVIKPLLGLVGGPTGLIPNLFKFADGGIMGANGPVPLRAYASGGVANSPQLALFGEGSTPEAYVPLPDGRRIPVAMKGNGGGNTSVVVNVDASGGSQVQGDPGQAAALGRVVSQAVQAEIIRQRRPGGLLAA